MKTPLTFSDAKQWTEATLCADARHLLPDSKPRKPRAACLSCEDIIRALLSVDVASREQERQAQQALVAQVAEALRTSSNALDEIHGQGIGCPECPAGSLPSMDGGRCPAVVRVGDALMAWDASQVGRTEAQPVCCGGGGLAAAAIGGLGLCALWLLVIVLIAVAESPEDLS